MQSQRNTGNFSEKKDRDKYSFSDIEYFKPKQEAADIKSTTPKKFYYFLVSVVLSLLITIPVGNLILRSEFFQTIMNAWKINDITKEHSRDTVDNSINKQDSSSAKSEKDTSKIMNDRSMAEAKNKLNERNEEYSKINKDQDWEKLYQIYPDLKNIKVGTLETQVLDIIGSPIKRFRNGDIEIMLYQNYSFELNGEIKSVTGFSIG